MGSSVSTVAYLGLEARAVEVQCRLLPGVPKFVVLETQDPSGMYGGLYEPIIRRGGERCCYGSPRWRRLRLSL